MNVKPHSRYTFKLFACMAAVLAILPSSKADFYEEVYDLEEQAATSLIESGLYDYAEDQIKHLRVEFRQHAEEVDLVEAQLMMAQRRRDQALKILDKVPKTSNLYPKALLVKITAMSDPKEKVQGYKVYFGATPKPTTAIEQDHYRRHVMRYVGYLMEIKDTKGAREALDLLKNAGEADSEQLQRRITLLKGQINLAAADELKAQGKPLKDYQKMVEESLAILKELIWQPDYFAALAYPEIMHAYNLLNDADTTKQMFDTAYPVLKQTEDDIRNSTGSAMGSPLGPAIYHLADSFMVRAQSSRQEEKKAKTPAETDQAKAVTVKNLTNAAKLFYKVYEDYTQSSKAEEATAEIAKIKKVLDKYYGVTIEVGNQAQQIDVMIRTANENYREGRFSSAADAYLEALRMDSSGKHVLDAAYYASSCYYRTDQFWRAMAMNDLLLERFPDADQTGNALYNTGIALYKKAKELEAANSKDAEYMMGMAVGYLTLYVEKAPTHPFAADTAYRIAEGQYSKANELRKKVQELEKAKAGPEAINQAVAAAKAEFLKAVPLYESVVENHPASKNALLAYRKLGWIYQIAENHELEAAENFLAYSDRAGEDVEGKIETKFMAADNLMRANDSDGAIENFKELISWTEKGGKLATAKNARKYLSASQGLLPWAYDQKAQQLMNQITTFQGMLADAKADAAAPKKEEVKKEEVAGENNVVAVDTSMTVEEIEGRISGLQAQVKDLQDKALAGLVAQVEAAPKATESAVGMAKIGSIYGQRGDFDNAAKWLEKLDKEFPDTPSGQQALFTLFRSYLNIGNKEKARQVAQRMIGRLKGYNLANVVFIATRLFETDERLNETLLDADLALAANREIIDRAKKDGGESAQLQGMLQRSLYNELKCIFYQGSYQDVIAKADSFLETYDKSPYYFDVLLFRGKANRKLGQMGAALEDFQKVLSYIDQNQYKATYYEATVEAARTLNESDQEMRIKQAVQRVKPVVDFASGDDKDLQPWIEALYYELFRSFSFLGDLEKAKEYQQKYLEKYIHGLYRKDIVMMPAPKF